MTPRQPFPLLLTAALAGALALVGDAGATPHAALRHAAHRHAAPRHAAALHTSAMAKAAPAPAAPTTTLLTHPANPTAQTSASFTFAASSGATVTCSLDGSAARACTASAAYSGLRAGTHTFALRAASGTQAKVTSYSWSVDTSAPTVPTGLGVTAAGSQEKLSWHAATDPDSSLAYTVYRNGTRVGQTSATAYTDAVATSGTRYTVAAYDPAGNTSAQSAAVTVPSTGPQPLGVPGSWTVKFDDEFSGSSLDLTKWQPNWLAGDNTSITTPPNSADLNCEDPAQVSEGAGVLHLAVAQRSCRASNGHTFAYAGGLVNTYNSYQFTYGYIESRIYIPPTGSGAAANFPAFWADGTGTWPATGELDVMEVLGSCLAYHFHSTAGAFGGCATIPITSGWHTFGADWQAGVVTYYYDGVQVGQITRGITGAPMYLILDNNVDTTYGGPTVAPADVQVDYVRAWQ